MEYKNIHIIYFSPTHTSAKTAYAIAEGLSGRRPAGVGHYL